MGRSDFSDLPHMDGYCDLCGESLGSGRCNCKSRRPAVSNIPEIPEDLKKRYEHLSSYQPMEVAVTSIYVREWQLLIERIATLTAQLAAAKAEHGKTLLVLSSAAFETIPDLESKLADMTEIAKKEQSNYRELLGRTADQNTRILQSEDKITALTAAVAERDATWIKFPGGPYPEPEQPILYSLVSGETCKGMRTWDGEHWWWCDENGEYSDIGNDADESFVVAWMPLPIFITPPRTTGGNDATE
jgi:hypothetical protein